MAAKKSGRGIVKKQQPERIKLAVKPSGAQPIYDRAAVSAKVLPMLAAGMSLNAALRSDPLFPSPVGFRKWLDDDPELGTQYSRARELGYKAMGEDLAALSAQTHTMVTIQKVDANGVPMVHPDGSPVTEEVFSQLTPELIALRRIQIDTQKWLLSKMLPKTYGDKVTQEHTGAGGGPIQLASVNLRNLSSTELEQMEKLMEKAAPKDA